ncbi:reverse transcriptase-like protein [Halobacillus litoralis]|uniref:Reverse transcriptase-like protein n=1 Tax=Halobacillus litoralis TaxID=45668 RepID=A0A845E6I9_9BACI|nr:MULTISPECIES: reverse transcriptase-like protein [Halobacillus]MYL21284.1 reverse transcriptase-like protein [Halobacillus litoralis]MYL30272.1 reverse transcriptase-like protein [Halobacillus halophilus]MYL38264.1 reverse transcriptase-like protein [Halobacillus litoralis]
MNIYMEMTYRARNKTEAFFKSEPVSPGEALLIAEDLEKTGRLKEIAFIDDYDTSWKLKDLKKYMEKVDAEPHNIRVYFDGGYDRNDRKAGLGCAVYYEQDGRFMRLRKNAAVEELDTNNEAEYAALYFAVQELEAMGVGHIPVHFIGDSQVVINQMKEEWPTMEHSLHEWADRIDEKLAAMAVEPSYHLISRKDNRECDRLATQALQGTEVESTSEVKG